MLYLRNLRVQLQKRRNRLYKAGSNSYDAELKYLLQFLNGNPYIRSLLSTLEACASVDFKEWESEIEAMGELQFPDTEEGRAKVCFGVLRKWANDETNQEWRQWFFILGSENNINSMLHDFTETIVDPFINFLHDRIDDGGNVLFLIERFKLKVEWFRQKEFYSLYKEDTSVGEKRLDRELRASLFEGGVDFPFSEPSSPSGKVDIVALLGSDDPLVLEVKVFDPNLNRDKSHLRRGFHQVLRYANDYNQSLGYLVIFNCSDRQLVISSDDSPSPDFPPRIAYAGKTFFVVPINVRPDLPSASKEKPASRMTITSEELTRV